MRLMNSISTLTACLAVLWAPTVASAQCTPDSFEPNDSCATAAPLTAGAYTNLSVEGFASVGGQKQDYYDISVPPGNELDVEVLWDGSGPQLQIWLYDDGVCTTGIVDSDFQSWDGQAEVHYNNISGVTEVITLRVRIPDPTVDCIDYDMNVAVTANPCVQAVDDLYEDNDDCNSPAILAMGSTTGLAIFGANSTQGDDEDWYEIPSVPAGDILSVQMTYSQANGDLAMGLYSAPCAASSDIYSNYQGGVETIEITNDSGAARSYWLRVEAFDQFYDCGTYDLDISSAPDPCNAVADDTFSPNHGCGTPATLTPGTYTGLTSFFTAPDFFEVTIAPGKRMEVEALFSHAAGNIDLKLYDASCASTVSTSSSWTDDEIVVVTNSSMMSQTYTIEVLIPYAIPNCNDYDLVVDVFDDPCLSTADDVYFPNFTCGAGPNLAPGLHPNLFIAEYADDFFFVDVSPGATLNIDLTAVFDSGDVSAKLYDPQIASCDGFSQVASTTGGLGNTKTLTFTNQEAVERTYELQVYLPSWDDDDCNTYELLVTGAAGQAATPMCLGDGSVTSCPCGNFSAVESGEGCVNSQGHGAILTATGTNVVSTDDMGFSISQARPNQPALLIQGAVPIAIPFKDGILCTGNPTERLEVIFLDANGEGASSVSIVTEGNITLGMTTYYQAWYRDPSISPCGVGSNFTQGLEVQWL